MKFRLNWREVVADQSQGYGSATRFRDCSTKNKIKFLASTWSRGGSSLLPVCNPAKNNLWSADYMKCRSTLLIRIWILAFCLCIEVCNALFLPWKWSSHWHWWLLCAAACQACLPSQDIDCKVIEWKFRCPILAAATSSLPDIFHLQWSCLKSTLLITRVSQP